MRVKLNMLVFAVLFVSACTYLPEETESFSPDVIVEETGDYVLLSSSPASLPQKALLFVPGGFVDPHVYICWMTDLVIRHPDIAVIQIKVPSNLAITNSGKIDKVMKKFDNVQHWVIGGHSLGGVVAAFSVSDQPDRFDGLLLMASWATESKSLRSWDGEVLSLYGTKDGLATIDEIDQNSNYLPAGTAYHEIEGGNHSGFGCYGFQDGDMEADISQEEQQEEMVTAMISYFESLWD